MKGCSRFRTTSKKASPSKWTSLIGFPLKLEEYSRRLPGVSITLLPSGSWMRLFALVVASVIELPTDSGWETGLFSHQNMLLTTKITEAATISFQLLLIKMDFTPRVFGITPFRILSLKLSKSSIERLGV